jgi:CHAD domain-containing protein
VEHVETERKYDAPDSRSLPELKRPFTVGKPRRMHLGADYVDTVGHTLVEAGYSLRRRTGGDDEGWHLKFPRVGDSRRELHAPLAAGVSAAHVPRALRAEIEDVVGLEALLPIARLDTERTEREVRRGGVVVARLADDRVRASSTGGNTAWREVEVELVGGDTEALEAIEELLLASGFERSKSASKVGRALEAGPRKKKGKHGKPTAGDVVLAHLGKQVGTLQGLEGAVRRDAPDAVHKARVATRRLRSTLRTYRRLFDRSVTEPLRDEVKWLGEMLGAPRDAEVLMSRVLEELDRLEGDLVVGPVRERSGSRLAAEQRAAHEVLVHALDSERFSRLMESLVALLVEPPFRGRAHRAATKVLPAIAAKAERRVEQARALVQATDDEAARLPLLHEVRKKAKAARYAYDALVPVFGDDAQEASERWEHVTEELGEFQDTIVVTARLRDLSAAAEAADESAFTYGVLVEREQERGRAALEAAQAHLDAAPGGLDGS